MDPRDFTKPDGDLPEDRFPDINLSAYLREWIERGEQKVGRWLGPEDYYDNPVERDHKSIADPAEPRRRERAIEAYVYWKAWDHVHERLSGEPKAQSTESWSAQYSNDQIESYRKRAERARERYEDIVSGDDSLQADDGPRSVSTTVNLVP